MKEFPKFGKFVRSARAAVTVGQDVIKRVGNAIIGTDYTGNARGEFAIDLQIARGAGDDVVSADYAIGVGQDLPVRVRGGWAFSAAPFVRADDGRAANGEDVYRYYNSAGVFLTTREKDLKSTGTIDIYLPAGVWFAVRSVGLWLSEKDGVMTGNPTICIGTSTAATKFLNNTVIALAASPEGTTWEFFCGGAMLAVDNSEVLRATVVGAATGSATCKARFFFRGLMMEKDA